MDKSENRWAIKKNILILLLTTACSYGTEYLIGLSGEALGKYEMTSLFMMLYLCLCKFIND